MLFPYSPKYTLRERLNIEKGNYSIAISANQVKPSDALGRSKRNACYIPW